MHIIVVRHHAEDSPGLIGTAFEARGAELATHQFPAEGPLPPLAGADHVIVLGAIGSVYDDGPASAWIEQELAWLRRADEAGLPVFGVCFGAQALCAALGGRVVPAARKEVGWTMITSFDPALVPAGPWLQFHGDRCLPPPRSAILARNEVGVQAFAIGRHLAVQFHPEADGAQLRRWMDAGARAEAERAGQDPDALLAETVAQEPAAKGRADLLVAAALLLARGDDPPETPAVLARGDTMPTGGSPPGSRWPGTPAVPDEPPSAVLDGPDDLAEQ
jgi:GMP synthase-like glutamine amidotransferase